jgi:transcriptional regulator with XRE-family HTH domain
MKFRKVPSVTETTNLDPEAVRLGATIKALREAYGLRTAELAEGVGISDRYLRYLEDGTKKAPLELCRKMANFLNIPLAAIAVPTYGDVTKTPAEAAGVRS